MALRFFKWYPLSANIMKKLCWNVADNHNVIMQTDISQVASRIIHVSVQVRIFIGSVKISCRCFHPLLCAPE